MKTYIIEGIVFVLVFIFALISSTFELIGTFFLTLSEIIDTGFTISMSWLIQKVGYYFIKD